MAAKRFYEIDLLRFVAAFAVLLFHYTFRGWAADHLIELSYASMAPVTRYGYLGVDLFFLISGFVILMTASNGSKQRFAVSRVVRLYPTYWVSCTASFVVLMIAGRYSHRPPLTWPQYAANLTMLHSFINVPSVDSVYWSLAVELKFYLLVFLVLAFRQLHRIKLLLGAWLVLHVVLTVFPVRYVANFFIPQFAPHFIAGATFYLISKEGIDIYKAALLGACYVLVCGESIMQLGEANAHYHTTYSPIVVAVTQAIFFAVFFLISTGRTAFAASRRWLVLGALTYPLYLLHQNIGFALMNWLYPRFDRHLVMWGVTAAMLLAAYGVTRIERLSARPFQAFLNRVIDRAAQRV